MMIQSPEARFLLRCASPVRTDGPVEDGIDWDRLLELAESHRLVPLLHRELNRIGPEFISERLETTYRTSVRNSMMLTRELVRTLEVFRSAGIQALPFKGPTLAIKAYGNISLRSFDDLDIILRPADLWKARDIMADQGFTAKVHLSSSRQHDYIRAYDELVMYGPDRKWPLVELHWGFVPPHFGVALDLAACWDRREQLPLANRAIPSLHLEDLILVLAIHGSKHCWSHLGLITDMAWLLVNQPIDMDAVLARATRLGIRRMLLLGAALASSVLHAPLSASLAQAIAADNALPELISGIEAALFGVRHDESSVRANFAMHLRMRERRRDRIRYSLKLTFRAGIEDWHAIDLPGPLRLLYPLVRFPRLALKYSGRKDD